MEIKEQTAYDIHQLIENEKGWLFYGAALKGWKELYQNIIGDSVLDLGCASGISLSLIKTFNPLIEATGLEGNDSGKSMWDLRNLNVISGDIYNLPFDDNSFDTVYSSHVIEHLEDPTRAIEESIRVAKKRIIHIVPDGNVDDKNHGSPHLHYFNRINFQKLFENRGLKQVVYKPILDNHINSLIAVYDV